MPSQQTNAYGELNPLYPTYEDKEEELNELMRFFEFSYQSSSGYAGTAVFEILDNDTTYIMTIKADPEKWINTSRCIPADNDISFHCTLPYTTFHNVFWGYTTARTLVMGGGCKIKNWAYRAAFYFGTSFDMTSTKWVQYYQSGQSIRKMSNISNENNEYFTDSIKIIDIHNRIPKMNVIGAELPTCADDTDFMYEWEPQLNNVCEVNNNGYRMDMFGMMDIWRNKQRNMIEMNNNKHLWLWNNSIGNKCVKQMESYRENLTFNPMIIGKGLVEKWKHKIKRGGVMIMEEYYGYYSQYTRNKIGTVSLGIIHKSVRKFNALVYKQTAENEVAHFSLLNSMF
eukprot:811617_1